MYESKWRKFLRTCKQWCGGTSENQNRKKLIKIISTAPEVLITVGSIPYQYKYDIFTNKKFLGKIGTRFLFYTDTQKNPNARNQESGFFVLSIFLNVFIFVIDREFYRYFRVMMKYRNFIIQ